MSLDRDPIVRRAIDELRELPASDPVKIARVVQAAAEARLTPADDFPMIPLPAPRAPRWWAIGGVAVAAGAAGFAVSAVRAPAVRHAPLAIAQSAETRQVAPVELLPDAELHPVARNATFDALPVDQQFVFNNHAAQHVSLVGDFNQWSPSAAPMRKSADGDLWSVSVRLSPGRHVYGFMVNDSIFVLDPRAPHARDADLGADGSVVVVGMP